MYLPDELHQAVKDHGLDASALLQEAIRVEVRRRELLAATDNYLAELAREVGRPDSAETARAEAWARRLSRPARRARA